MPTVFSAKLDGSEAIRYNHVSMVAFYLHQACSHAHLANSCTEDGGFFKDSLLSIIFTCFCLEAFVNEMAESVLDGDALRDFAKKVRRMTPTAKLQHLIETQWKNDPLKNSFPMREVEEIFRLRNKLVHYNLSASAGKVFLPGPETSSLGEGRFMTVIDFMKPPTRIEPPVVESITPERGARAYNTALKVLNTWNSLAGVPDALAHIPECVVSSS